MVNTLRDANTDTYNGRELRQTDAPLMAGATSARPLGARSGVRPGTPATTAVATSTTWTVQPFAGVIDFVTAAEAGPYRFAFDAVQTGSVTAAAGSARIDILYVEGNDPAESAGTPLGASVKYLAGSAGSGVPPATPARSFVVAHINVPASGGGAPTVTWVAPYCAGAGGVIPFNSFAQMDAVTTLPVGTYADVFADPAPAKNGLYRRAGTAWFPMDGDQTFDIWSVTGVTAGTIVITKALPVYAVDTVVWVDVAGEIGNSAAGAVNASYTIAGSTGGTISAITPTGPFLPAGAWGFYGLKARVTVAAGATFTLILQIGTSANPVAGKGAVETRRMLA